MPAYLVRLKDDDEEHARELVGIFVAQTMGELYWAVDEAASPCECKCLELGPGGIHWEQHTEQRVPRDVEPDWEHLPDSWSTLPAEPTLTDEWDDAFAANGSSMGAAWQPIIWSIDDETAPAPTDPPRPPVGQHPGNVLPFRKRRREA